MKTWKEIGDISQRVSVQMSVFMKNPNNNSVNYCKSLFLETDETAGPLNPE